MTLIQKIQVPEGSGFNRKIAMELANLIAVAYNEYEVWDSNENLQQQEKLPSKITGSEEFADLKTNSLECQKQEEKNGDFEKLNKFWIKHKTYKRLKNFLFPQWFWLELLKPESGIKLLSKDIKDFWAEIKNIVTTDQVFGFIAQSEDKPNQIFVVFRGTREGAEWFNNFRPKPKAFLPDEFPDLGEVRNGFNLIYTINRPQNSLQKLFDSINLPFVDNFKSKIDKFFANQGTIASKTIVEDFFENLFQNDGNVNSTEIFITGHSLGAGLATLAALHIQKLAEKHKVNPNIQLYTFASPRVGDEAFARHFDDQEKLQSYRIINSEDLIQSVPLPTTEVVDEETRQGMSEGSIKRLTRFKELLRTVTKEQSIKHYQHVGVPITFTQQTKTIAGNHNLTNTYRRALFNELR